MHVIPKQKTTRMPDVVFEGPIAPAAYLADMTDLDKGVGLCPKVGMYRVAEAILVFNFILS